LHTKPIFESNRRPQGERIMAEQHKVALVTGSAFMS
jgi:hypothetical protein